MAVNIKGIKEIFKGVEKTFKSVEIVALYKFY